ncbi:MAG: hypothetical protein H8D45_05400 [Bacteroidetes bacterium]|nr:hypothetical protein [Bacteroidota bacterium]MBL7104205.1 hypothetical protein [Bacteroidales bacterium]
MNDRVFVDTNIWVYAKIKVKDDPKHKFAKDFLCWKLKEKYHYSVYDSLILASAIEADCTILFSEDLHHNQLIENKLRIINPFR